MSTRQFGTFRVVNQPVATGVFVQAGDTLSITSTGTVQFGGTGNWIGNWDANGANNWSAPDESRAPSLTYLSLIWASGRTWRQGGTNTGRQTVDESGEVILACNERVVYDNTGGWQVTISRETATDRELPRPSASSSLVHNFSGDFELVVTHNQSRHSGGSSGDLNSARRSNSPADYGRWYWETPITQGAANSPDFSPIPFDRAFRLPCWFRATDGQLWGVCVQGRQVKYFIVARDRSTLAMRDVQGASDCVGAPALTQSGFGSMGNFELIVPVAGGGMDQYWLNRDVPHSEFNVPWNRFTHFGRPGIQVLAARLMFSTFGNLEVLALEQSPRGGLELVFYWQNGPGGPWSEPFVIPGSTGRVNGIPAFIQSSWGLEEGNAGTFEVIVPSRNEGLLHFTRYGAWRENPAIPNSNAVNFAAVHMIQNTEGSDGIHGNFEVVAETGNYGTFGYGQLFFCWFETAPRSWSALSEIIPVQL